AFLLGYALCQVPGGMLADRFGARRVLAAAALSWVAGTALLAAVGWLPYALAALLALRFLIGAGEAPTFPAAAQAVARWIPVRQQARANGLVIAAIGLGSAIAPPLLTAVMLRWGWRGAVLVSALPALAVGVAWLFVREPAMAPVAHEAPAGRLVVSPSFVLLTASYTLQGYVGYIFVFWFYLYLVEVRHFDLLRGALLGSLPWLLSIVSIPLGGWLSDRLVVSRLGFVWGRRLVPMTGLAGSSLFLALGAHTGNAYLAAVCLALSTALVLSVEGPFWATMTRLAGARAGAARGVMTMGPPLGGLISPVLTPALAAIIGWENSLHIAAALAALGGLLWLWIEPAAARERADG
ncbi:MAG: MFS transporter, partial [Acidobacteria bacterium]|nr:MFS transporter [Acidobacteriota bacterium]